MTHMTATNQDDLDARIAAIAARPIGTSLKRALIALERLEAGSPAGWDPIDAIVPADAAEREAQDAMRMHEQLPGAGRYEDSDIQSIVHRVYRHFGVRPQLVAVEGNWDGPGWTLEDEQHHSIAERQSRVFITGPEDAFIVAMEHAIEIWALTMRQEGLEREGHGLMAAPSWSFIMHPVARAILEHHGVDPEDAVRINRSRIRDRNLRPEHLTEAHTGFDGPLELFSGVHGMVAQISRLTDGIVHFHQGRFVSISIRAGEDVEPSSLVGMTVGEATGHPALADVPVRVVDAWRNGGIQMELEPVFEPVSPPPAHMVDAA